MISVEKDLLNWYRPGTMHFAYLDVIAVWIFCSRHSVHRSLWTQPKQVVPEWYKWSRNAWGGQNMTSVRLCSKSTRPEEEVSATLFVSKCLTLYFDKSHFSRSRHTVSCTVVDICLWVLNIKYIMNKCVCSQTQGSHKCHKRRNITFILVKNTVKMKRERMKEGKSSIYREGCSERRGDGRWMQNTCWLWDCETIKPLDAGL